MSGGIYDYIYGRIDDIDILGGSLESPHRIAFQKLLKLVARAMHDIEWVDSGDYGTGDENKAIDDCFAFLTASPEIIAKAHAYDEFKLLITKFLEITPPTPRRECETRSQK